MSINENIDIDCVVMQEDIDRSEALKARFAAEGIRAIGLLGSPGSGKTTLLEGLVPLVMKSRKVAVIEGDIATDNDARRVSATGVKAVEINTDGACHLDAAMVERAYDSLQKGSVELLLIENVGNLVCPVDFPVGEAARIAVISVAEGEDKPLKYPAAVMHTQAVIITKTDLAPYVRVDPDKMVSYVHDINPAARVFFSCLNSAGKLDVKPADGGASIVDYLLG